MTDRTQKPAMDAPPEETKPGCLERLRRVAALSPPGRWEWPFGLALALGIAAMVAFAGALTGYHANGVWIGAAAVLGAGLVTALVLGPPRLMLTVFVGFMMLSHQDRSFAVIPFAGVEWHPRELLLFVLFAFCAVRFYLGKADLRPDIMHYCIFLYMAFFGYIAAVGLLRQQDLSAVIAECRYPLFLASFFVFVATISTQEDLHYYLRLILGLSLGIAAASLLFFIYTLATGNVVNVQNALGEYVPRQIGPFIIQSVRPNGHPLFEIGAVMTVALLLFPETSRRHKVACLAGLALFSAAILITMMRTAYISLAVSLLLLLILLLPREVRTLILSLGVLAGAAALSVLLLYAHGHSPADLPGVEVSIKGRLVETEGALQTFLRAPLFGAGMGSTFRGMGYVAKTTLLSVAEAEYQTVHNVWLYFLFKGGLMGFVLAASALGGMTLRAYHITTHLQGQREQIFMCGMLAVWIGQLIASVAMPRLTSPFGAVLLSLIACAFVVVGRKAARAGMTNG